jgi:Uma2 family endonuclease
MDDLATPETLVLRWGEMIKDPSLQDLPYKIELNAWGNIEMGLANNRHARLCGALAAEFSGQMRDGVPLTKCSILTKIGIRVPDVAWASAEFMRAYGEITPYERAPEICVEIVSLSSTKSEMQGKTRAYLDAGAKEVWLASEEGSIRFFGSGGEMPTTGFAFSITLPPPIK